MYFGDLYNCNINVSNIFRNLFTKLLICLKNYEIIFMAIKTVQTKLNNISDKCVSDSSDSQIFSNVKNRDPRNSLFY